MSRLPIVEPDTRVVVSSQSSHVWLQHLHLSKVSLVTDVLVRFNLTNRRGVISTFIEPVLLFLTLVTFS